MAAPLPSPPSRQFAFLDTNVGIELQRQAGRSRLQMAYLTVGNEEARCLMSALDA